jgi:transposase
MKRRGKQGPKRQELRVEELKAILDRARGVLEAQDLEKLTAAIDTLAFLTSELEAKGASIARLRRWLFGASTEKTSRVVGEGKSEAAGASGTAKGESGAKEKQKGHGRNGAESYRGAEQVKVPHAMLHTGDRCPLCEKGKVYVQAEPAVLVRVKGIAPLMATVYEKERLRCNACLEVFTAASPPGVGSQKYDETAASMIGLLKYGCGLPFHRLARLEGSLGIPLPAPTQWEVVQRAAGLLEPAYGELVRQAAQGEVVYNDDTTMKILELDAPSNEDADEEERSGVFTTGIVSTAEGRRIALFFTGRQHAGENLADVLAKRAADLTAPIQMCDALSSNTAGDFETILANCIAHARRRFVDVADNFPDECRHVLETLRTVYEHDAVARRQKMTPEERLRFHQAQSAPLMGEIEEWLRKQIEQRKVEPNSGLGEAIGYMRKHWQALTLFLREPGAPLDNNLCERALKKAILHRKNALFYKTENGARVGDLFMTLIHTAELHGTNPFHYLVALQRHHERVTETPSRWMPWNYAEVLGPLTSGANPPR